MSELTIISIVFGIVVAILSVIGFFSNKKKDDKHEGTEQGQLMADVRYIKNRQDDVYIIQKEMDKKLDGLNERVVRLETRMDEHDKQISKLDRRIKE